MPHDRDDENSAAGRRDDVGRAPLLVSNGFQTDYERGFCNGVAANGIVVTLISSDTTDYSGLSELVRTRNLRGSQDRHRGQWTKALNLVRYHCRLLAAAAGSRAKVIHVFGLIEPTLLCGIVEGAWFRVWSKRYMLTVHNLVPHDRHSAWQQRLSWVAFRLSHTLVVHTQRMRAELMRDYGVPQRKVVVMEHGLEPIASSQAPGRSPAPNGVFRMLFFGAVAHYKGVDLLLQALEAFPARFSLVIAGSCLNTALAADIERRIAAHPASGSISWSNGFVPEEELPALFGNTDAVVLPYRHIDQSGVLFQAMRFGVPVVATKVGAFADYVTPELGELCEVDASALREALTGLWSRVGEFDFVGISNTGRRFEWANTVRPLIDLYS